MANSQELENDVRDRRTLRRWSQEELARRAGLSRAGISAIETGRLIPSAAAALALAAALECRVEDLFRLRGAGPREPSWAWSPGREPCRYWKAEVGGSLKLYPAEATVSGLVPHDGVYLAGSSRGEVEADPEHTLVMGCCDPAAGLLAAELAARCGHSAHRRAAFQPRGTVIARQRALARRWHPSDPGRRSRAGMRRLSGASSALGIPCSGPPAGRKGLPWHRP